MRKLIVRAALVACALGMVSAAAAASFSWRFAGLNALKEKKDLVALRDVTGLPEFAGMNSSLIQRVAATLAKQLSEGGGNQEELAKLLGPIAADMVALQTVYELQEHGNAHTWTLAIQLPAERHEIWKANWETISKSPKAAGAKISREGEWTVLGNGSAKAVLDRAKEPAKDVLHIQGDAMLLQKFAPKLKPLKSDFRVSVQGKGLRSEGKVQFEQDLPFKLGAWMVPTNTIREPLVAFTAVQGVSAMLARHKAFEKHPAPNQIFAWSEGTTLFSTFMAARVDEPRAFLLDFANGLDLAAFKNTPGKFEFDTNNFGLYWTGLPIAVPFVRLAHTNDSNFVLGGLMPMAEFQPKQIPADLTREVTGRTNLLYYDWELTGKRLEQIRPISQIVRMAFAKVVPNFNKPEDKWLGSAEKKIGNTITEVSMSGPREVTFLRRSDLGFSALELFALVHWISGEPTAMAPKVPEPKPAP